VCPLDVSRHDLTTERIEAGFGTLENAVSSLERTLNRVCSFLNKKFVEGTIKDSEDFEPSEPFTVDGKTYYIPIPGERTPARPKHPYEAFEADMLPLLDEEKLSRYKDMKVLARGNGALAFYFYRNMRLATATKLNIGRIYRAYLREMKSVSYENIYIYLKRMDSG
jgi:hypothetical protein